MKNTRRRKEIFLVFFLILIVGGVFACRQREKPTPPRGALPQSDPASISARGAPGEEALAKELALLNGDKIQEELSIAFKIIKTETLGYATLHKFYWVSLAEKVPAEKIEILARRLIEETIARQPAAFHSFTLHFFWERELGDRPETSPAFARATYLPFGDWQQVGRVPIDNYKNYQLTIAYIEKEP